MVSSPAKGSSREREPRGEGKTVQPRVMTDQAGSHFSWNLSKPVGFACPNQRDDVHLVQFAYKLMGKNAAVPMPGDLRSLLGGLRVGVDCTGREDDQLVIAIRAHQRSRKAGGAQDGKVSVMAGSDEFYKEDRAFIIALLNNNLFDAAPETYPRIDKIAGCPTTVQEAVRNCFKR